MMASFLEIHPYTVGRLDAAVAQQLLDVADVHPILQQMGGERVAQGMEMR